MRRSWFVFKQIYIRIWNICKADAVYLLSVPLATKSEKRQFGLVFVLMKGKRNVFCIEN